MKPIQLFLLFFTTSLFAQFNSKIDTTYTISSTFSKEKKAYPFITIAKIKKYENVKSEKQLIYYKTKNRKLHFDSYLKKTNVPLPAVILIHGGGWKSGNKSQMEAFALEIANKGYQCFAIEYRLSNEYQYPTAIIDVKNAIKFIKLKSKKFYVDATKIAVLGYSAGGQMAALIGTTINNSCFEEKNTESKFTASVQAIIDIDGILAFKHPESKEGAVASLWLGGNYDEKTEIWQQASALTHTDKNTPPTLFINSSIDRFHAGRDDMIAILNHYNIYNEVRTIKNSPHSFWFFNPWFEETVTYTSQFLDTIFK